MRIFQVDAFTSRRFSGNPATVVLDAAAQSDDQYAKIAREFAHAETAFVLPAVGDDHDVGVRFLNSRKEAAFVGHATLAVHHVLLTLGMRDYGEYRQKSRQGIMAVRAERDTDRPLFEFRQTAADLDASLGLEAKSRVAHALGLSDELLHKTLPTVVARKGSTRLPLPLTSATSLGFIKPDFAALVALGTELGIEGFFPFVVEQDGEEVRTRSRMFCPALGIPEDPVSGNAHAMLATHLWRLTELHPLVTQFSGSQGEYVNRAGTVNVRLEIKDGELIAAHIGGHGSHRHRRQTDRQLAPNDAPRPGSRPARSQPPRQLRFASHERADPRPERSVDVVDGRISLLLQTDGNLVVQDGTQQLESEPGVDRGQTSSATSARKIGTNSRSNHGLRFNQPVLRHEGCGKGSLLGPPPVS